jgi:hypothetical protein
LIGRDYEDALSGSDPVMTSLRMSINDEKIYDGAPMSVPRVGDEVRHNDEVVRVTAVVWEFVGDEDIAVQLLTGERSYTF